MVVRFATSCIVNVNYEGDGWTKVARFWTSADARRFPFCRDLESRKGNFSVGTTKLAIYRETATLPNLHVTKF